jgi:hypothetical protein
MKCLFLTFLRTVLVTFSVGSESMQSLDMLTINEEFKNSEDLAEIMWKAFSYFPRGIWEGVNYVGNINVKCQFTELSSFLTC